MTTNKKMPILDPFNLTFDKDVIDSLRTSKINPGIFQLSSSKTSHFAHGYKTIDNEDHIIALNALLRPSCMDIKMEDGKTIAEHYVMRLNGGESVTYLHPSLEPILKDTYGFAIFQEQNIRITSQVAGFDLVKADLMRISIGKKDFTKMESLREDFIKGCQEHSGIEPELATRIFNEMRASARYQFNKSHATSYGQMSCIDLWFRYYYPHLFFATKISYTFINVSDKDKRNTLIKDLIRSAKERNIETVLPNINRRNVHTDFSVEDNKIYMGFNCIAGTGSDALVKIFEGIKKLEEERGKGILEHTWLEILLYFSKVIGKKAIVSWISLGVFDKIIDHRRGALSDYNDWLLVSKSTVAAKWMAANPQDTFSDTLKAMVHSDSRLSNDQKQKVRTVYDVSIQNRPKKTGIDWSYKQEQTLLGVVITHFDIQGTDQTQTDTTLAELDTPKKNAVMAIYVTETSTKKQKDGRDFCFVTATDNDGNESSSVICFANEYSRFADLLYPGARLLVEGSVSDRGSFIINQARHIAE
jgi:DNA polymerase III alpha subunit